MAPQLVNSNMADGLLSALCNTLLHSLWQGIILAAIAGIIVISTRKAAAALRYNLLVSAMLLFAIGVGATFVWQYSKYMGPLSMMSSTSHVHVNIPPVNVPQVNAPQPEVHAFINGRPQSLPNFGERWGNFLTGHHDTIVLIWFLIVCARSLQLAFGLYGTYRLRRVRVFAADKQWAERLQQLADNLGIKRAVRLLESGIAKVPMMIGHLKPVVLVPVGLLTTLSAEEVEAILIHELAHIKRRDYLVNMLQSLMEIVFFFNPAVLWVSKLIKTERENCCDDLALAQNNNKLSYIRALVSCEEFQASVPPYAMGFPGGKHTLLDRVKRMVSNRNHSLNMFEKTVLAVCLVALGLGVSAFTAREQIKKTIHAVVAAIHHNNKAQHKQQAKPAKSDTTKKKQAASENKANQLLNNLQLLHPDTLKLTGSPELDALIHKTDSLKGTSDLLSGLSKKQLNLDDNKLNFDRKLSLLNGNQSVLANNSGNVNPLLALAKPDTNLFKHVKAFKLQGFNVMHDIGQELYRERLITDTNHLNISLNEKELIVNGVRMPAQVHDRIYRKFGRKGESGSYGSNYENGGSYGSNYSDAYVPKGMPIPPQIIIPDFGDTLVKYGVIKDKRHIRAIFNSHQLTINGIEQPDNVRQMLLKKYGENVNINYTNNGQPDARMEQNAYWANKQRKIIDQMQREGLINDRRNVSFTLTNKTFVINGLVQNNEVFERYRQEYVPANAGDDWIWNHNGPSESYMANANRYGNSGMYYQLSAQERQRIEAERDKKLVADLLRDGLITDPNNVTFTLSNKKLEINGKKESEEMYKKYKEKYVPNDSGGDWSWTYSHHQ